MQETTQQDLLKHINEAHVSSLELEGRLNHSVAEFKRQNDRAEKLLEGFQNTLAYVLGQIGQLGLEKTLQQMLEDLEREEAKKARRRKQWKR